MLAPCAAQFQGHPLDRLGGRLGDRDAGPGRAGEAHHVDVGMMAHGLADGRPVAIDQVEDPGRETGLFHHFGEQHRGHRRDFGRFEDHRATDPDRRHHFQGDLVHRPVPRRDQAAHANRLVDQIFIRCVVAQLPLEVEVFEGADEGFDMAEASGRLGVGRQLDRRAHFGGNGRHGRCGGRKSRPVFPTARRARRGRFTHAGKRRAAATALSRSASPPSEITA